MLELMRTSHPWPALRTILVAVLVGSAMALGGSLFATVVPPVTAADPSSDIPGLELPGPVAAGRLGGAIYDVVYRLTVEPGHVLVASLTGTEGTDFDMYLFDSTATTVLSNAGLLTKSNGPTSTESISWPSRVGAVYYIDLNGATDVEGDYRLTVQTVPDPTPPVASITLAAGRASTNQLTVPVNMSATEDLSGVAEMAFSSDGAAFGDWQPFQAMTTWTFTPGDGSRNLWAKVRNGVGLESSPAVDAITIDTTPPSVIRIEPAPGSMVVGLLPTFSVTFNEPINPATWSELGLIVQSGTGALVTGTYAYDTARRVGSFIPATPMQAGASYVVNVGLVRDIAGNNVAPLASWPITPLTPTSLTGAATPKVIRLGGSSRIAVSFAGAPSPTSVEMLSSNELGGFDTVSSFDLVDGALSLLVAPVRNTTYRFQYAGAFGVSPAQLDVRLLVRRSVVLAGRNSAAISRGRVGTAVKLTAAISPAAPGASISFKSYRFDPVRRTWVYAGSFGRKSDSSGRAVLHWTPTRPGSYYWRASVAPTPEYANNISPVYRWSISR